MAYRMRIFLVSLFLLLSILILDSPARGRETQEKDWTLAVFLNADNDLAPFGEADLREMAQIGSSDWLDIVVLHDRPATPTDQGTTLLKHVEKNHVKVIEDLGERDMGDPQELTRFMERVVREFPARRYALVVWNHGAGWRRQGPARPMRGISYDETNGTHITTEGMGQAVRHIANLLQRPLDVLIFDACLMQMAEVVHPCAASLRFLVASEETEPGSGAPYNEILLRWRPDTSPEDLARLWVKTFADSYSQGSQGSAYTTQSALDASRYPAFLQALDAFAETIIQQKAFSEVLLARRRCLAFADRQSIDLLDFVDKVLSVSTRPEVIAAGERLRAAGRDLITANATTGWAYQEAKGLAIYLPMTFLPEPAYRALSFAKSSRWTAMMSAIFAGRHLETLLDDLRAGRETIDTFLAEAANQSPAVESLMLDQVSHAVLTDDRLPPALRNEIGERLAQVRFLRAASPPR